MKTMNEPVINQEKLKIAANQLRAIAHPIRLNIISFIHKKGNVNVNKIYSNLKLEQSITSQHLKILRSAGLVITKRDGKFIIYSLNYDNIKKIMSLLNEFFKKPISKDTE